MKHSNYTWIQIIIRYGNLQDALRNIMFRYQWFARKMVPGIAMDKKKPRYAKHLENVFLPNVIDFKLDNVQCQWLDMTYEKNKYFSPFEVSRRNR